MSLFKMIKGDSMMLTGGIMILGIIVAFATILTRLGSCTPPEPEQRTNFTFKVEDISFITLKQSKAQVKLKLPSLPEFSDEWTDNPKVYIDWRILTRGHEKYSGRSIGLLAPPYDSFIFSIQDDLEAQLGKVHSEQLFIYEYRIRLLRDVTDLWVDIRHPETDEIIDSFHRRYAPDIRKEEGWAID